MLHQIKELAAIIGSVSVIAVMVATLWKASIQVNDMVNQANDTACKVNLLENKILQALRKIQAQQIEAQKENERRFDRIEKELNYLFGRTGTPPPQK